MENAETITPTLTRLTDAEPVTETLLRAVAERTGCSQLQLPLLYDSIDPDALNALIAGAEGSPAGESVVVEFEYAEYAVRIVGTGTIELRSLHPPTQPVVELGRAD